MLELLIPTSGWLVAGFAAIYIHQIVYVTLGFLLRCPWVELGSGRPRFTLSMGSRQLVVRRRVLGLSSPLSDDHQSVPSSRAKEFVLWLCSASSVAIAAVWVVRRDFSAIAPEHPNPWMYPAGYLIMMLAVEAFASGPWYYPYGARLAYALTGSTRRIDQATKRQLSAPTWAETRAWMKLMRFGRSTDHAGIAKAAGLLFERADLEGNGRPRMSSKSYSAVAQAYVTSLAHLERFDEAVAVAERYGERVDEDAPDAVLVLCLRCAALSELDRGDEALALLESMDRSHGPQIAAVQDTVLLVTLVQLGRYEEAYARSHEFLTRDRYDVDGRFEVEHIHLYIQALLGRLSDDAEELTRRCLERTSDPGVRGTLGAVLVQVGDAREGIRLLERALPAATKPLDRLETLRFLAIGHGRLGETEASNRYRDQAIEAHPPFAHRLDSLPTDS